MNKLFKKILIVVLVISCLSVLAACKKNNPPIEEEEEETPTKIELPIAQLLPFGMGNMTIPDELEYKEYKKIEEKNIVLYFEDCSNEDYESVIQRMYYHHGVNKVTDIRDNVIYASFSELKTSTQFQSTFSGLYLFNKQYYSCNIYYFLESSTIQGRKAGDLTISFTQIGQIQGEVEPDVYIVNLPNEYKFSFYTLENEQYVEYLIIKKETQSYIKITISEFVEEYYKEDDVVYMKDSEGEYAQIVYDFDNKFSELLYHIELFASIQNNNNKILELTRDSINIDGEDCIKYEGLLEEEYFQMWVNTDIYACYRYEISLGETTTFVFEVLQAQIEGDIELDINLPDDTVDPEP